ncbi:DUF2567 domain-containing protein [Mycolicibacterium litorale]|uniref:DUF2567 domain-containing protein n=1 Tax=Mycolicibacterium litorale TaxID=758802 RepID=UPI001064DDF8|nr:DUF2567 domain-containing protein [Mycolicibacterium litorale]MCV7414216.1 DUF2567 domain-containing protein [Mycolicibacterium litorale]TDY02094.1 uncharacterized protein DUF2567 [Mycolicibacterium litorale]
MKDPARPRFSRRRAALTTVGGLVLAGAVTGALWSVLAPPVHGVVALTRDGERVRAYVGGDADHFFTAAALFVGMLAAVAVVAAVWLWQWRAHRGPVLVAALAVGAAAAAGVAAGVGAALVRMQYGTVDVAAAPVTPDNRVHHVIEAPAVFFGHTPLQIACTIIVPAAIGALVYAICAVAAPRDDLGGWPPQEFEPLSGRKTTADGAQPVGPPSPSH